MYAGNYQNGFYKLVGILFISVIMLGFTGMDILHITRKINFIVQQFIVKFSEEVVVLHVENTDWLASEEKEIIIDGNYFDIKSYRLNEDGSAEITAKPDEFDSFLFYLKENLLKKEKSQYPIHSQKSRLKHQITWIVEPLKNLITRHLFVEKHFSVYSLHDLSGYPERVFIPPKFSVV